MSLEGDRHQKSRQLELPLEARGETVREERSGESSTAARGDERSGSGHLMELVVEKDNAKAALKRVKKNRGSPGSDGMTVEELTPYLVAEWLTIKQQLLDGSYQPRPVLRKQIPKSGGGVRDLGIPCALDRMIQQAILQVLQPIFDPTFSEHSYGFRPGRGAHGAVCAAQRYIQSGRSWVVDVDLEKFFDRVNHDVLMGKLEKRIGDKRLLGLIRRYLGAGVMDGGVVLERHEGTPQGGPLSPLLANVLLDEVDKELEKRGHAFVRYADDCNVYVQSRRAGERVLEALRRLYARLKLKVNEAKSAVALPQDRKFLGYSFWSWKGEIRRRVAPKALDVMKDRVRQLTSRSGGRSMQSVITELRGYLMGWKQYFRLTQRPEELGSIDGWIRRRLRALQLKLWKRATNVYRQLRARGMRMHAAAAVAAHTRSWWRTAAQGIQIALTNSHFAKLGLPSLVT